MDGKRIFVYGGDLRSVYMAEFFKKMGYPVVFGGHDADGHGSLEDVSGCTALVLGLPAIRDGYVYTPNWQGKTKLEDILCRADKNMLVAGGKFTLGDRETADKYNVRLFDYADDEVFQTENAFYTAEGALSVLISNTSRSLREQRVLVAGYGRIAEVLSSMLFLMGCSVEVYARSPIARAKCQNKGAKALGVLDGLNRYDAIINTVPADIFSEELLSFVKKDSVIIDLSARPGYVDKGICQKLNIKLIYLPGLPLSSAPCSAGEAAARAVIERL